MASITSTIKEAYLFANTINNQCGIHLAVWLYSTYSMDPAQRKNLLMTQIGLLDIMKSKSFSAFLAYVERLGHIGRSLTYDEASLLNTTITEILKLNHTSLTTVITAYRASTTITLEGIVTAARLEYHSAI